MRRIVAALLLAVAAPLGAAMPADDFYQARLQEGRLTLQTGRTAEAADLLRLAGFGLMDSPPLYTESLVFLGIAQERLGRGADVDATLRRFLEAEKRFGGYGRIALPEEARREFDALLLRRLPSAVLLSVPGLARLVETEEQKVAKLPPAEREPVLLAKAKAEPSNPAWPIGLSRLALEKGDARGAAKWAEAALAVDARNVAARKARARAFTARKEYAAALADLAALPQGAVEADPALKGDLVVCLAGTKRWAEARAAAKGLPAEQLARPDVSAALAQLPPAV